MIVQCRSCMMRYHLDDGVVGSKGCHVRCTTCQNVWFQDPPPPVRDALVPRLPVVGSETVKRRWGWTLVKCMVVLGVTAASFGLGRYFAVLQWPGLRAVYHVFTKTAHQVEVRSFSFQRTDSGEVVVQGLLTNMGETSLTRPRMQIVFVSVHEGQDAVVHTLDHVLDTALEPQKPTPFTVTVKPPVSQFSTVHVLVP